ncbi:MAG: hypothetical protein JWR63_3253, partial [Conexibacter sp.]|nr:hypothetical protein [Conexibacter sp.]
GRRAGGDGQGGGAHRGGEREEQDAGERGHHPVQRRRVPAGSGQTATGCPSVRAPRGDPARSEESIIINVPMPRPTTVAALAVAGALAAAAAGCGGGTAKRATSTPTPRAPGIDPSVLPPPSVPTRATRPADAGSRRVIEAWLADLRHGDLARAAHCFAIPSVFQNGTPVLHLDDAIEVAAVVASFPCGAVATRFGGAGRYTIVRFRLTERTGGDCRGAAGHTTGGAIRVSGGRIREWYRLYDPEEIHPAATTDDRAV